MTAQEHAKILVEKFMQFTPADEEFELPYAKQCALICVGQMIMQNGELYLNGIDADYYKKVNGYLFEVKSEIEKL